MVTKTGAKLLDFGIARLTATPADSLTVAATRGTLTVDGSIPGTIPAYCGIGARV
jgi:hypothetical protein